MVRLGFLVSRIKTTEVKGVWELHEVFMGAQVPG